jgi:hypothetical protein
MNKQQLHKLHRIFEFPDFMTSKCRYKFSGEEVLLIGITRLVYPVRLCDPKFKAMFGLEYQQVSAAVLLFFEHMDVWTWLIEDNMKFWLPYLQDFEVSIWRKMVVEKGCVHLPRPGTPGGFNVSCFGDGLHQISYYSTWWWTNECRPRFCPLE